MSHPEDIRCCENEGELNQLDDDDRNGLEERKHSLESHLDRISEAVLELMRVVICDMLNMDGRTTRHRGSTLKESDLLLIESASRVIYVDQWQIVKELEEIKKLISENQD